MCRLSDKPAKVSKRTRKFQRFLAVSDQGPRNSTRGRQLQQDAMFGTDNLFKKGVKFLFKRYLGRLLQAEVCLLVESPLFIILCWTTRAITPAQVLQCIAESKALILTHSSRIAAKSN